MQFESREKSSKMAMIKDPFQALILFCLLEGRECGQQSSRLDTFQSPH